MPAPRPLLLLLAYLCLNLLQAGLTPLDPDETYYWMYASRLDWGYFDHPPAVALLIGIGRDWLPGALGLRLGHVLAGAATAVAVYRLLDRPVGADLWLAAGLFFAQPMLQVYGFIATPDGPLLLCTALYLLAYRHFLRRPGLLRGGLWGLTMAGLMYSKYHGAILIACSVLPHLGLLLRQPGAWLAAIGGAALFTPHLYWQYANDYPSFRYHLSGRSDPYELKYTLEYLGNQLLIFSPLLVYYYVKTFTADRARTDFGRACRWLVAGFLLFFLYTTSKGGTEAQWTALLAIPLIYLTYTAALRFPGWRSGLRRLCLITVVLLCTARVLLVLPREWLPFDKPFDHAPWVERLSARAGDLPVMVENSYRLTSLYQFYSGGKPAWTFTDVAYRPNQYDLWRADTSFHGRSVLLFAQGNWRDSLATAFALPKGSMLLREIDHWQVARLARLRSEPPGPSVSGQAVTVYAESPLPLYLTGDLAIDLYATLQYADGTFDYWPLRPLQTDSLRAGRETVLYRGEVSVPDSLPVSGEARLGFGLGYRGMPPLRGQSQSTAVTGSRAD